MWTPSQVSRGHGCLGVESLGHVVALCSRSCPVSRSWSEAILWPVLLKLGDKVPVCKDIFLCTQFLLIWGTVTALGLLTPAGDSHPPHEAQVMEAEPHVVQGSAGGGPATLGSGRRASCWAGWRLRLQQTRV